MGRPELNGKTSGTLWSALQRTLQGVNRATRAMEIGTGQQHEHGRALALACRDFKRGRTPAQEFRPEPVGQREGGQAGTQNSTIRPASTPVAGTQMRAPTGGAYGYSRHKNRMPELYRGALKEVLPRCEALVNGVRRFGAHPLVKCLSRK